MKRDLLSIGTKRRIFERDNYTCVKCGFTKVYTMLDIPKPFKVNYLTFITFESIIVRDRLNRVLDYIDDGGAIDDIVFNWQSPCGLEIDHILAVCNGGSNDDSNLQCLCTKCHRLKTSGDLAMLSMRRQWTNFTDVEKAEIKKRLAGWIE